MSWCQGQVRLRTCALRNSWFGSVRYRKGDTYSLGFQLPQHPTPPPPPTHTLWILTTPVPVLHGAALGCNFIFSMGGGIAHLSPHETSQSTKAATVGELL